MRINQVILAALALGMVVATPRYAIAGYIFDDFEAYLPGSSVNTLGNGWGARDSTALVTNLLAASGSQSLYVPQRTTVTNSVATNVPHIWTEFRLYDSGRVIPGTEPAPRGTESVMMGISTGGYALVYDPGVAVWTTCTNDVWGTKVGIASNAWATFAVFQDYANHTNAVFLNGHLMRVGLPFISNSLGYYRTFKMDGGNLTNSFLDCVIISNAIPPSLTNADLDNDGVLDATEIETYGNVTTCRRLTNSVSATAAGTINPTGTFTVTWNTNLAYSLSAAAAYVVGTVTSNGVDVGPFTGKGTRSATYTDFNITNDRTITASFIYTGIRDVPGDYGTITGALAEVQAGDQIVVSNAAYDGSITLSNGVMLVGTNLGVNATNLTINGGMTVATGKVSTASGAFTVTGQVNVVAGGLLTISNTTASFGGLATGAGGKVKVVGGTLAVGGTTNGPGTYWTITNMVSAGVGGSISPSGTNTMLSTWQDVTYALTGAEAYVVAALTNNGVVTFLTNTKTATYTDPQSNITNDQVITAAFVYNGIRYVPGDHVTITDALAVAHAGDQIVVSNAAYDGSITLSNGVTLIGTNLGVNATNLTVNGALSVVTGSVNIASGSLTVMGQVSVAAGGLLTISNATTSFGGLTFADAGGQVRVVGGVLTVNGIRMEGTFTLDTNWQTTIVKSTLNFTDGFENYVTNVALNTLGRFGWAATGAGAVVQDLVKTQGVHAALIPASVAVSNTVSAAGHLNVWTELYLNETAQVAPFPPSRVNSNSAVMLFFGTNGYLTVYNPALANWDVCSNDVVNQAVAPMGTGQWVKLTIFQNFSDHTAAIFMDNRLLREQVGFISNSMSQYGSLKVESGPRGTAYVDDVSIWANMPAGLTNGPMSDLNHDGIPDAVEIQQNGVIPWSRGSIFKLR